ncbi:MAG: undecaprenyl-diphosphate phosphatase [Proteobacteria bacterium]|nr:undecaprenyl-diphosphate phosphatase [Pseudomonadota bacterium]
MNIYQAAILGIIQGLTEFLPVSSSGHLVLFQHLFGLKEAELLFDISVHLGTLAAVVIFFRSDISAIIVSVFRYCKKVFNTRSFTIAKDDFELKLALLIVAGSVPTAIIGLMFKKIADQLFSSVLIAGSMLILTGLILQFTRFVKKTPKDSKLFSFKDAIIIGISQGLAIMPGLSRSGTTISTGLFLGLNHETAAKYSFLLSIPAIVGACLLSIGDITGSNIIPLKTVSAGIIASCLSGYFALKFLLYIVKKGRLHYFSPYCFAVGIFCIIIGL